MNEYLFKQMRELLGSRYDDFVRAYDTKPRRKSLRVNTLKISESEFAALCGYELAPNPLCAQSFYTTVKPSLDPLYHAGLYYMQEASASAAVAAFSPFIGERVFDLCAAPGGKTTQAAAFMNGRGVIYCNDVESKRVRVLCENIERLGVTNAVVTSATAGGYRAAGFDGYFDTLIVDAPCSGGGMTRNEDVPLSAEIVAGCAARQRDILKDAAELVADGGYMLYSTCTFSREENEDNIEFLAARGFTTVDIPLRAGEVRGIDMPDARRIYPMNFDGEGHFYCVLRKNGGTQPTIRCERVKRSTVKIGGLELTVDGKNGEQYIRDFEVPRLHGGVGIVRAGVRVAVDGEYTYALSHALKKEQIEMAGAVELGDDATKYIRGEQLEINAPRGFCIATVSGYALGWVKSAPSGNGDNVLKNLYPKGLRINRN